MKLLIAGDYCDRYRVSDCIRKGDFATLFDGVKATIEGADYAVVNFEFPIVDSQATPIQKCGPNLKGQPAAVDAIKYAGFNCCTLANNHILDQGAASAQNTKRLIEQAGLDTVGLGDNLADASQTLFKTVGQETLAIINCCEHEFSIATDGQAGANPLDPIRQYHQIEDARKKADYVVVIVHGGIEQFQLPTPRMTETYRFFIEAGADAVVNHHQHCFSGYEIYRGKPIFYGLGNFLFDKPQPSSQPTSWNQGFMLRLHLEAGHIRPELLPYQQCLEQPSVTPDSPQQADAFFQTVSHLNKVIADESELRKAVNHFYGQTTSWQLNLLEPYSGRIAMKLLSMGLLPHFVKGKKLPCLLNHIEDESHRERLIYALKKAIFRH